MEEGEKNTQDEQEESEETSEEESSELEIRVEDSEEPEQEIKIQFRDSGPIQRISLEDVKAPVLEEIAVEQESPIFVGTISQSTTSNLDSGEKRDNQYISHIDNSGEPKYIATPEKISGPSRRIDMQNIGRDFSNTALERDVSFQSYEHDNNSPAVERVWQPERIDAENVGRNINEEREEIKYEKYESHRHDN